ncbi:MAG: DUF2818 family protein [Acidithiobacillus sp.]|nr:DUF2818 family protein [Acidithiobacillus sp.]
MALQQWAMIYILVAFIAANLPWLSGKRFVFGSCNPEKTLLWYLGEWFVMYLIMGLIGMGVERLLDGQNHGQGWEFYVIALCMFAVFAIPGFIWRFNIVPMLRRS